MGSVAPEAALLRRHGQRGAYDIESAKSVFDDCFIAHVSYVVDGLPACMPMIALIMEDPDEEEGESQTGAGPRQQSVYLHGHPTTKLMELVKNASRDVEDGKEPEAPVKVCITSTKIDGLVLSSAPNGHTFNYRSATIHGTCSPVRSKTAKRAIMRSVTNKIVANRWEEVNPVASLQVSLVYVVKVAIDSLSVKTRAGVPGIQPRNKEADGPDNAVLPWTGVLPLWEQLGTPVDSGLSPGAVLTENVKTYMAERNAKHKKYSEDAAR